MSDHWGLEQGTYRRTTPLHYGPLTRTYLVHVPARYDAARAWPLVFVLHGAFSTAGEMERRSGFSRLADREGFIVAYPSGIGLFGFLQHWNAGHCCGWAKADHVDDVGFLCYVVGDISHELHVDPSRVYVAGHSNDGMLAHEFARAQCRDIAAIAVVAGTIGSSGKAGGHTQMVGPPEAPVPLITIHGWDDKTVPFAGRGAPLHGRYYMSVFDSVDAWAPYCGCDPSPRIDIDPESEQCIVSWRHAEDDAFVVLRVLNHRPHKWPGPTFTEQLSQADPLHGFDAAPLIWDFLHRHRRTSPQLPVGRPAVISPTSHGS